MDVKSIINNITYRKIPLPDKERLDVSEISGLIAWALYPSGANLIKAGITPLKLENQSPATLRYLVRQDVEKAIRAMFLSCDLKLRNFIGGSLIQKDKVNAYNPFDLKITFDDFVKFVCEYDESIQVAVMLEKHTQPTDNHVYLTAREVAELTIKAAGKEVITNETLLKVAYQWVLDSDSGWVEWRSNPDIQMQEQYATSNECLEAITNERLIKLEDAILWGDLLNIPTDRLKEKLEERCPTADKKIYHGLGGDGKSGEIEAVDDSGDTQKPSSGKWAIHELIDRAFYSIDKPADKITPDEVFEAIKYEFDNKLTAINKDNIIKSIDGKVITWLPKSKSGKSRCSWNAFQDAVNKLKKSNSCHEVTPK